MADSLEFPTNYWLFAFVIASTLYTSMIFIEKHLSGDAKAHLGLWAEGEYSSDWHVKFNKFFDFVFGEKHVSFKCFIRSACVSIITCYVLYFFLAHVLQVIGKRTEDSIGLVATLSLGIFLNVIPDYLSLLQTRWLLGKLKNFKTSIAHFAVFLIDVFLSSVIILVAILVYQLIRGEQPKSAVEILALFSVFSIFFYSTFSTSLWAWIYCVSAMLMAAVNKPWMKSVFYQPDHPMRLLALTISFSVFCSALILTPLFVLKSEEKITRFDKFLCSKFPDKICLHSARLLDESSPLKLEYLTKGCIGGDLEGCTQSVLSKLIEEDVGHLSINTLGMLCEKEAKLTQKNEFCYMAGLLSLARQGDDKNTEEFFRTACLDGHSESCRVAAHIFSGNAGDMPRALYKHMEYGARACLLGSFASCTEVGIIYMFGEEQQKSSSVDAERYFRRACKNDFAGGCFWLGNLHLTGGIREINGMGIPDLVGGVKYWEKGCSLGHDESCKNAEQFSYIKESSR